MRMFAIPFGVGVGVAFAAAVHGYMTWLPSYDELSKAADAVVVAVPLERKELSGKAELPGVKRGNNPIPAVEIRTTFRISAVLRGDDLTVGTTFDFHHYREEIRQPVSAAPARRWSTSIQRTRTSTSCSSRSAPLAASRLRNQSNLLGAWKNCPIPFRDLTPNSYPVMRKRKYEDQQHAVIENNERLRS